MHVDSDLSAYLDGELAPAERTRVEAHVASCERCRDRLGDLRATAALVAALPAPRPSRSLVPAVTQRWSWLRPARALSAIATGAFLFAFLLTAIGRYGAGLGGGDESTAIFGGAGPTAAPAVAPAQRAASATRAPSTSASAPSSAAGARPAPSGAPQAEAVPAATASGPAVALETRPADQAPNATRIGVPGPLLEPLFWLGLAVIAAVLAIAAHRRLRMG